MEKLICVDIKVNCILDKFHVKPEIMGVYAYQKTDGTRTFLPCNGCEDAQGSKLCARCYAEVDRVLYENPDWNPRDVIYPKLHQAQESQ